MAELSVQIGADVRDLLKKLDLTEAQLKKLGTLSKTAGKDLQQVGTVGAKGMNALGKSTANAVPSLTSFSQVIQDAPYGIRGVANNITQLTSQFGYLSASAGGAKGALKAMLGTLAGPAGILLAVSVVTSLLVSYGDKIFNAIGATNALTDATKEYLKEASAEQTQLQALVGIAQDETKSKGIREEAIKKLNTKYKDYLGNLTLETINSNDAKIAVDALSASLIRQAQIRGISKLIEEKSLELAEKEIEAKKDGIKQANKTIASGAAVTKSYNEQREAFLTFGKDYKKVQDSIRGEQGKKIISSTIKEETSEIKNEVDELVSFLQSKLTEQFEFDSLFKLDGATAGIKRDFVGLKSEIKTQGATLFSGVSEISTPFVLPKVADEEFIQSIVNAQTKAGIVTDAINSSFSALAGQISSSLSTGVAVIDAFVSSIIQSLAQMLAQMVTQAITQSIVNTALANAAGLAAQAQGVQIATQGAAALGPAGVIALPGLLAATQGMITGALAIAKVPKFAKGGFSGDDNLAFLNKNELVLRPFEQSMLLNSLRGSGIANTTKNESSNNGIVGEMVLRGQNQVVQLRRAERNMKRYYNN